MKAPILPMMAAALAAGCSEVPSLAPYDEQAAQLLVDSIDIDRAMTLLADVVAAHQSDTPIDCRAFGATVSEAPELCSLTHGRARQQMQATLQILGYDVRTQRTDEDGFVTENLIAERRGGQSPDDVVEVVTHVDAFYAAADDNSSGCAGVLELATVLAPFRLRRTVRFVAFDLEETHHTGSSRYVKQLQQGERPIAVLNLDGLGWTSPKQDPILGVPLPSTGNFLAALANSTSERLGLDLWALNERFGLTNLAIAFVPGDGAYPMLDTFLHGDQTSYWLNGLAAVALSDTGGLRGGNRYHSPDDSIAYIDRAFFRGTLRLAAAAVWYWAGGAT